MTNTNIKIVLTLAGYLKPYVGTKEPIAMELPQGAVVQDAIDKCQVPAKLIKIININGLKCSFDTILQDGDQVYLQPIALGG